MEYKKHNQVPLGLNIVNVIEEKVQQRADECDYIDIDGDIINTLEEAATWLKEAWIYEPYNIYYYRLENTEYIDIEPVDDEDYRGCTIDNLKEFEKFIRNY